MRLSAAFLLIIIVAGSLHAWENHSHEDRRYKLYVPSSYTPSFYAPVIVAFHGKGDTYSNFATACVSLGWDDVAEDHGALLVVPEHDNPDVASFLSYNSNGVLDGAATGARMEEIFELVSTGLRSHHEVDLSRITFLGFSEGGHFADLGAYWFSHRLYAAAIYAGGIGKSLSGSRRAIPLLFVTGQQDPLMWPKSSDVAEAWSEYGFPVYTRWPTAPGHSFSDLCDSAENGPHTDYGSLAAHGIHSLPTPLAAPGETLRRVHIRVTSDDAHYWTCTPGPNAWATSDGTHYFVGLRAHQDHIFDNVTDADADTDTATTAESLGSIPSQGDG